MTVTMICSSDDEFSLLIGYSIFRF